MDPEEGRFELSTKDGRFYITDNMSDVGLPSDELFWDDIIRLRMSQLREGTKSLVPTTDINNKILNFYNIACLELTSKPIFLNSKKRSYRSVSDKAIFSISNDGNNLIIDQTNGPALYRDNIMGNKFFYCNLLAGRALQLSKGSEPLSGIIESDDDENYYYVKNEERVDINSSTTIAKLEIEKGIYIGDEFFESEELSR